MSFILAVVGPLEMQTDGLRSKAENFIFDLLHPDYCVPHPKGYTRLSEMLADGWTATAMVRHPTAELIIVSLRRSP